MYGNTELQELIDVLTEGKYGNPHLPNNEIITDAIIDVMGDDALEDEGLFEWCNDYIEEMILE